MRKKILLGCLEPPGYGGAGTSAYKLFETIRGDGFDVCYVSLLEEQDVDYYRYVYGENFGNPKCLPDVYDCVLKGPLFSLHPGLADLIDDLSPDLLVGVGYIAALMMKQAAPEKRLIFITSGCQRVKDYMTIGKVRDFISLSESIERSKHKPVLPLPRLDYGDVSESDFSWERIPELYNGPLLASYFEREAVKVSDLVVTHSDMIMFLYRSLFPSLFEKVYSDVVWFAEWICKDTLEYAGLQKPFHERDIDVIFIASIWSRPEKNYGLVEEIVSECEGLSIHIVGETEKKLDGVKHHGLITEREHVFGLLGRAKTIVCPSLFDAAPGILFEASVMGCNIIASKNCGNWKICNEKLLVARFNADGFSEKIRLSLSEKYPDDIGYFIHTDSYKNLIDTILVF